MKYAVILSGNKQIKVSEGDIFVVERLSVKPEEKYTFENVLLFVDGETKKIGTPLVKGASVTAKVIAQLKGPKLRVAKFKSKVRYRKVIGFRSSLTKLQIEKISAGQAKEKPVKAEKEK